MSIRELKFSAKNWLLLTAPTKENINDLSKKYHWSDKEIFNIHHPKLANLFIDHPLYVYFTLNACIHDDHSACQKIIIHFFISSRYLITISPVKLDLLEEIFSYYANQISAKKIIKSPANIAHDLLQKIIESNYELLATIESGLPSLDSYRQHSTTQGNSNIFLQLERLYDLQNQTDKNIAIMLQISQSKSLRSLINTHQLLSSLSDNKIQIKQQINLIRLQIHQSKLISQLQIHNALRSLTIVSLVLLPAILIIILSILWLSSQTYAIITLIILFILEIFIIQYIKYKKWV